MGTKERKTKSAGRVQENFIMVIFRPVLKKRTTSSERAFRKKALPM